MNQIAERDRIEKIAEWMKGVIEHGMFERYDDLHLDRIDPAYADPLTWCAASATCLERALAIRDANHWVTSVALGMSLRAGRQRVGLNFRDYHGVAGQFDWTPPSLYLFPLGDRSLLGGRELEELGPDYRAPIAALHSVFFREWLDAQDSEYRRTLWFLG